MAIIAIDGGGTKTLGIAVRRDGTVISTAQAGGSNMNGNRAEALHHMDEVVSKLTENIVSTGEKVESLFAGLSGIEHGNNRKDAHMHLQNALPMTTSITVENDAITALYSGTMGGPGIVQIAGTGSITYGVNEKGLRKRVGGWGYLVGDPGSGYAIGREGLIAALRAWDGIGAPTRLMTLMLETYSLQQITEIIPMIYGESSRQRIAALALLVMKAADEKDEVAQGILTAAASAMGEAIVGLHRNLYESNEGIATKPTVVLTGGIFKRADLLLSTLKTTCLSEGFDGDYIVPKVPPVVGAAYAAMRQVGIKLDPELAKRMDENVIMAIGS
ncbi:N-acetylglucosamine kinase [Paenibacillus pini]|uniref:Kinase n=1 Tax=Paenibacillus pini JCM 16418 TaxID=1236976 RepID=W7Y710_9BACL|nr:BadF/BadG/BcrA/BcrD ATPase family protein [Paenibacillus pini]GAF06730.1 kinase [Paenibacillus pini JCM 16418]